MISFEELSSWVDEACEALMRNFNINLQIVDRMREENNVSAISFKFEAFSTYNKKWYALKEPTVFVEPFSGLIDVDKEFQTNEYGWDKLLEQTKSLNIKTQNILRISYWLYCILKKSSALLHYSL